MRKLIVLSILTIFISGPGLAQKATDGFLGLKWESTSEEIKRVFETNDIRESRKMRWIGHSFHYSVPQGKWEKIGEVPIASYYLQFSESDKLYMAETNFYRASNLEILLRALTMNYGKPTEKPIPLIGKTFRWKIDKTVEINLKWIEMGCEDPNGCGTLQYIYLPVLNEIHKINDRDVIETKDRL